MCPLDDMTGFYPSEEPAGASRFHLELSSVTGATHQRDVVTCSGCGAALMAAAELCSGQALAESLKV